MASGRVDVLLHGTNSAVVPAGRVSAAATVPTPASIITPSGLRFAGDPGLGNFYLGVTPTRSTIAQHELHMNAPLGMIRSYSTSGSPNWTAVDQAIAGGYIPWTSWLEGSRTVANIASGAEDAWIAGMADEFITREPWPIWWTFHHEPENDASVSGGNAQNYRNAQRRIKQRFKALGVTNDTFACCCYMTPFTWNESASGRDWRTWYPDWRNVTGVGGPANPDPNDFWVDGNVNSVVDVIGLDFYHGWDLAAGQPLSKWLTVTGSNVYNVRYGPRTGFLGKAYAVGEWSTAAAQEGFTVDPNHDGTWTLTEYNAQATSGAITYRSDLTASWMDDYFGNRSTGTAAFCYWDSALVPSTEVANNPLSVCDLPETRWQQLGVWGRSAFAKQWTG